MKKILSIIISITAMFILAGCNTMGGVGEDVERAGEGIQRAAN